MGQTTQPGPPGLSHQPAQHWAAREAEVWQKREVLSQPSLPGCPACPGCQGAQCLGGARSAGRASQLAPRWAGCSQPSGGAPLLSPAAAGSSTSLNSAAAGCEGPARSQTPGQAISCPSGLLHWRAILKDSQTSYQAITSCFLLQESKDLVLVTATQITSQKYAHICSGMCV